VLIVIHQGHLPHQDAVLLSAELMRETGRKGSLRSASCFSSAPAHIDLQTIGATRFKSWNPRRSDREAGRTSILERPEYLQSSPASPIPYTPRAAECNNESSFRGTAPLWVAEGPIHNSVCIGLYRCATNLFMQTPVLLRRRNIFCMACLADPRPTWSAGKEKGIKPWA
jgi:hypothetical protein